MQPGFRLNLHDRESNPCFESHDPSMMWDPVGKCYYSYCTDSAITSSYRQGIPVRRSRDLVNFEFVGYALSHAAIAEGRDNGPDFEPTRGFWAPYVEYCNGEYRMYYSATKAFGSSESRIWLAVSDKPEGPFENRGVVMDTWNTPNTEPNAIDAHVADTADGRKFFIYGSYFGGIFCKELEPVTGMPINPDVKYQGIRIAKKPAGAHVDGPEGAAVIYNPHTAYYYLFLSYGWLGDNYDIRVGRSREITGPYLDFRGKNLDGESLGMKLAGSYCFAAGKPWAVTDNWQFGGFRGPGHGVPFYAPQLDEYFFVHHVRDGAEVFRSERGNQVSYRMHYMVVRRMYFLNGWPIFSPQPFAGESAETWTLGEYAELPKKGNEAKEAVVCEQGSAERAVCEPGSTDPAGQHGDETDTAWEWLRLRYDNNDMAEAQVKALPEDLLPENVFVFTCFDFENSVETFGLSGITDGGEIIWGKKKQ